MLKQPTISLWLLGEAFCHSVPDFLANRVGLPCSLAKDEGEKNNTVRVMFVVVTHPCRGQLYSDELRILLSLAGARLYLQVNYPPPFYGKSDNVLLNCFEIKTVM